jgi:predicted ABC-type ATPase
MSAAGPVIYVLAGVNGAGKSSVGGAMIKESGADFFNPDIVARRFRELGGLSSTEANSAAWSLGVELLNAAISEQSSYAFETTLGGNTIPALLEKAAKRGFQVIVWYVGLATVEQHIARVQARVARGGHDIPVPKIHERWKKSPDHLKDLMPLLSELKVFDNSREVDPKTGEFPAPQLLLHSRKGVIEEPADPSPDATPAWARSIVVRAIELQGAAGR